MASDRLASSQSVVSSSSHRLPTVSASEVLQRLGSKVLAPVSTGLPELDSQLHSQTTTFQSKGGLSRGKVTEIYGPPGVGKSSIALQTACNALKDGCQVIWLDCGSTLPQSRLKQILRTTCEEPDGQQSSTLLADAIAKFQHYVVPTLAHLLSIIIHPTEAFIKPGTALIVIDSLSTVIDVAYHEHYGVPSERSDAVKWASNRRFAVLGQLVAALSKTAIVHDLAILVTSQTVTRIRPGQSAMLLPAISGSEWTAGLSTQLIMFRDWPPRNKSRSQVEKDQWARLRYIGLIKVNGKQCAQSGEFEVVIPVTVGDTGLQELRMPPEKLSVPISSSPRRGGKRTFEHVDDSDDDGLGSDEDYGWDEADALAAEGLVNDEHTD